MQIKRAAIFCSTLAFLNAIYTILYYDHPIYTFFCFFVFSVYAGSVYLYGRISSFKVALFIVYTSVLWIGSGMLAFGYFFSAASAFASTYAISYVLLRSNYLVRNITLSINIVAFSLASLFLYYKEPYFPIDSPIDQIFIYFGSLAWIIAVVKIYEYEKTNLLDSVKERNVQLMETKEELERFTYIASHDLKTPIRNIISFLGLLKRDIKALDRPDMLETLSYAETGAKQMSRLVNDILEWSFINSDPNKEKDRLDLNEILSQALENIDQEIKDRNATIHLSDMISYHCNKAEMVAVFQNLIQNGIKYNESETPTISIWTEREKSAMKICFKDNGIGIDEKYTDQIFEFFKRLHTSDKYEGTGLGLGLCKKIIEKYNGKIEVLSNQPEDGSTFVVLLPIEGIPA